MHLNGCPCNCNSMGLYATCRCDQIRQTHHTEALERHANEMQEFNANVSAIDAAISAKGERIAALEAENARLRAALKAMRSAFKDRADAAYCEGCDISRETACLGWVAKVKCGEYGEKEHDAHKRANQKFGAHYEIYRVLKEVHGIYDAALAPETTNETKGANDERK